MSHLRWRFCSPISEGLEEYATARTRVACPAVAEEVPDHSSAGGHRNHRGLNRVHVGDQMIVKPGDA